MSTKTQNRNGVKHRPMTRLDMVADFAAEDVRGLMIESRDRLMEVMEDVATEAIEQEKTPIFRIGFSIALDLQAKKMETALTYGVRHKLVIEREMPDPNQAQMQLEPEDAA